MCGSRKYFQRKFAHNTVLNEIPQFKGERAAVLKHQFDCKVRDTVKANLTVERRQKWEAHVKGLAVQGNFLGLAAAEKEDIVWKSTMYELKQGTLKFLLNASIDTLPTAANMKRVKSSIVISASFASVDKQQITFSATAR